MTIVTTVNSDFKKFRQDPAFQRLPGGIGREREIVVDVVITAETPSAGLLTLDLSGTGLNLTQVYLVTVEHNDFAVGHVTYVPATGNAAATGQLKLFGFDGVVITASSTTTLRLLIRGI